MLLYRSWCIVDPLEQIEAVPSQFLLRCVYFVIIFTASECRACDNEDHRSGFGQAVALAMNVESYFCTEDKTHGSLGSRSLSH